MHGVTFDNVSKKYELGETVYSTVAEKMEHLFARLRSDSRSLNPVD